MATKHRVLMLGWEIAPFHNGGLGVVSYYLSKHLAELGAEVYFVVPSPISASFPFMKLISLGMPYISSYEQRVMPKLSLIEAVYEYADKVEKVAETIDFDVIHAHDWLTAKAGVRLKKKTGKPLILHMHSTEFDRSGRNRGHPKVHEIEGEACKEADVIIAVSNYTKDILVEEYGVNPEKIVVIHNAINVDDFTPSIQEKPFKLVMFLGRLTLQKGVDYFLAAASKVLERKSNVMFVVAGKGEQLPRLIDIAINLGIADRVLFTGFLSNDEVKLLYSLADVFVMPSVSEPFGIAALEAMASKTATIVSKQSGVAEVINHALKVDFWDVNEIANKIVALLEHEVLHRDLVENAYMEVLDMRWDKPAKEVLKVYEWIKGK